MRFKFTAFLLALNVLTFGLIAYLNHQAKDIDTAVSGLSGKIGRELIEADRIELRGGAVTAPLILERKGSTWNIAEPIQWSANYFAINRILNQLQFLEEEASFTVEEMGKTGQTLADYGLEEPALTLVIAEGNESIELNIGTVTEIGNNYYLLGPEKSEIFVISGEVINGLWVDLNDLRTRQIFDIPVFEVDALGLQIRYDAATEGGDLKVRLAKNNGAWAFEAPLSAEADPALVNNTINTLTAVNVGRFIEEVQIDPLLQGLETPLMEVTIHGNKRRQTLYIGNMDPLSGEAATYFAKLDDNPAIFTVSARPFIALQEAQEALRERNFVTFDDASLSAINISENGRKVRLQKLETGNNWQVIQSTEDSEIQPHRADPTIIESLLKDLDNLKATGFEVDAPTPTDNERLGFNNPRRSITLSFADKEPLILTLAHPEDDNGGLFAKTNRADFIYEVDRRSTLRMIPLNATHYRNRTMDNLPKAANIKSIKLTNIESGESIVEISLTESAADWTTRLSELEPVMVPHIQMLLYSIRSFKVESYLLDRYEGAYPVDTGKTLPWVFKLSATIQLPGGDTERVETREYVFTDRLSGTIQVGGSSRSNAIFQITQPLIDTLYELTDDMELPPESKDEKVPAPESIPLVPEPATVTPLTAP